MKHVRKKKVVLIVIPIAFIVALSLVASRNWMAFAEEDPVEQEKPTPQKKADAKEKEENKKTTLSDFMHVKLDASNEILEGLLLEDDKKIIKGAQKMREMSDAEKWRVSNDMMYRHHSEDFRRNVDKLIAAAKGNSIDRAALNWFDVTLSCIDCHRWVRRELIADSDNRSVDRATKLRTLEIGTAAP
ncbi:MAG: hypothetical protein H8E37_10850 [Planctomycetes bacterium]|nr:hypothetical protein [Planctomycetota bacterium]